MNVVYSGIHLPKPEYNISILMEAFQDKNDAEEKKNLLFRGTLVEFMGYTSAHGFGRLVAATTFVWRIFWILAILGASGMFAVEVMDLFKLYLSRPVQTSVSVAFGKVYYNGL